MGEDQYQNPRREAIKLELAEMIKQRGLDFRKCRTLLKKAGQKGPPRGLKLDVA